MPEIAMPLCIKLDHRKRNPGRVHIGSLRVRQHRTRQLRVYSHAQKTNIPTHTHKHTPTHTHTQTHTYTHAHTHRKKKNATQHTDLANHI